MKYFGERSLSSVAERLLGWAWVLGWIGVVLAPLAAAGIIFLSLPQGDQFVRHAEVSYSQENGKAPDLRPIDQRILEEHGRRDWEEWNQFRSVPLAVKAVLVPYMELVLVLALMVIRRARKIFANFRQDRVFDPANVDLLRSVGRLSIALSLVTFSFGSFLVSLLLFLFCELVKNGSALQREQELTI